MKRRSFERIAGMANIVYALVLLVVGVLFYFLLPVGDIASNYSLLVNNPSWITLNSLSLLAIIIGVIGLFGMYLRQIKESSILLLSGMIFTLFGLIMKAAATSWEFIVWPAILEKDPASTLLTESLIYKDIGVLAFYGLFTLFFSIGYIIFGVASLKTKIFPKWASLLLVIGGPAYAILLSAPPFGLIGLVLYAIAILGYGFALYKNTKEEDDELYQT